MRLIPTRVHAVLDYMMGLLLIVAPWLLGFAGNGAETWVPVALGIAMLIYSMFTNYEFGAFKLLSVPVHLTIDFLGGAFLAVAPWIFGFADNIYLPHLILGIIEMGTALMTKTIPEKGAASDLNTYGHAH